MCRGDSGHGDAVILAIGVADAIQRVALAATSASSECIFLAPMANPMEAIDGVLHHRPNVVMLDLRHPELDAVAFVRVLRASAVCAYIPLLLIVPPDRRTIGYEALAMGADDFLLAPPQPHEYRMRIRHLLAKTAYRYAPGAGRDRDGSEHAREIRKREKETLWRLAKAGEYRDETTGTHILRLAHMSRRVAERLALPPDECEAIELAAPMHDIGKIGIPDALLRKRGPLTADERRVMESHTLIGYEILKGSCSLYLQLGAQIALSHHERCDGGGYPHGLRGADIPIAARIVAVADVFDALTSNRPYKRAWSAEDAIAYMKEQRGKHFDSDCVDALVSWAAHRFSTGTVPT